MEIIFKTYQGEYVLPQINTSSSLINILQLNKIPFNSVVVYGKKEGVVEQIIGLHTKITTLSGKYDTLIIQPDRNITYSSLLLKDLVIDENIDGVSEYTFTKADKIIHKELTVDDCKDFVHGKVGEFIENANYDGRKIVVGISGGGDSNTLIGALLNCPDITKDQIVACMVLGIPDWDKGQKRAKKICDEYGIEFKIINEEETGKIIGYNGVDSWVSAYEKTFCDDDLEVIGTLAVNLALTHVAKEVNAQSIVLGSNLEDLLAESFYMVLNGNMPLPFPVRKIGDKEIWYPLYKIPKKIIDGCYPKFATSNYNDRYPSKMTGRAIPYYIAQMSSTILTGIEFDLINGFQKLSYKNETPFQYDKEIGLYSLDKLPLDIRYKWKKFINFKQV